MDVFDFLIKGVLRAQPFFIEQALAIGQHIMITLASAQSSACIVELPSDFVK